MDADTLAEALTFARVAPGLAVGAFLVGALYVVVKWVVVPLVELGARLGRGKKDD